MTTTHSPQYATHVSDSDGSNSTHIDNANLSPGTWAPCSHRTQNNAGM